MQGLVRIGFLLNNCWWTMPSRYYDQDDRAGQSVSQTMNNLPPSHRAAYMKLQASIRSAYHSSVAARKLAEFKAQLSSVAPGGSLTPAARANPHGSVARKERHDRFGVFVSTWCSPTIPGPLPFFQGLWALMRLQALSTRLGGAGQHLIEWELDDAVFRETACVGTLAHVAIDSDALIQREGFHACCTYSHERSMSLFY
jgi:hypothetical protein